MATTFDYTKAQASGEKLLKFFGKKVTILKVNTTPNSTTKPWNGPAAKFDAGTAEGVDTYAAFVDPSDASKLGLSVDAVEAMRRFSKIAVVAHPKKRRLSLKNFHTIKEDATTFWKIGLIEELNPAGKPVLYFMGVRQ